METLILVVACVWGWAAVSTYRSLRVKPASWLLNDTPSRMASLLFSLATPGIGLVAIVAVLCEWLSNKASDFVGAAFAWLAGQVPNA